MTQPSLSEMIAAYRAGAEAFQNLPPHAIDEAENPEALIASTYGKPYEVLENWTAAAATPREAVEALRLALEFAQADGCGPAPLALMAAALGFLERTCAP
ncbi:hypothetical protein [Pannonibacter sp. SL95]|uniref:hypothetical protein n=1 Tax=Pannonibacter sp. SL95 TaxID=2995153 RepID=UPI00227441C0|nr:hypothetical protein [Pannonibacter sp. SL95]MCY1705860.1 hypothetical protein [Pannonibacter sp. SL95]